MLSILEKILGKRRKRKSFEKLELILTIGWIVMKLLMKKQVITNKELNKATAEYFGISIEELNSTLSQILAEEKE